MTIRVLSLNIHKGVSSLRDTFNLLALKKALTAYDADIVCLQEVQGLHAHNALRFEEWPNEGQAEFLASAHWSHFAYAQNASYPHGHHGNAILSKYPIASSENLTISTNRLEQRGCLHASINYHGSILHCFSVHLNLLHRGRRQQVKRIMHYLTTRAEKNAPLILAGDFNDWGSRLCAPLYTHSECFDAYFNLYGTYARTFPSVRPLLPLDRIYYRSLSPLYGEVLNKQPWSSLSDHLPLSITFRVK
jgi:endonuclease/exonuclease/phosphatase family metal-dependent hydrolase